MNRLFRNRLTSLLAAMAVLPGAGALAQVPPPPQPAQSAASVQAPGADKLTPSELETLLGPIALYPDPLLANVLAAAVYPQEVAAAAKFMASGGKAEQVDSQPWEDPVKAIAKIPDAIKMMGQFNDWTIALGQAYLIQAKDVMDVVQSLRKKAQASGALKTSPEQKVVVEQQTVYIKPADPEVIYVPSYSPSVVYVDNDNSDAWAAGIIGFGVGITTGLILANNLDCDWHGGCVGWGGGNNEVNINGDVNIGNRNSNISGNNVGNTANAGNRVGNQGNAWAPNKSKATAANQANRTSQFKGGASAANQAQVPGGRPAGSAGNRTAAAGQSSARPGGAGQPGAAQQSAGLGGSGQPRAAQQPARPGGAGQAGAAQQPARPTGAGQSGTARPATPTASPSASRVPPTPPRQTTPSAYSGGRDTQAASQRGNTSRAQSSSSAARPAPSRSAPARSAPARSAGGGGGGRR